VGSMIDPIILFFVLGLAAGLLRTPLRLPPAIYDLLSILLLLAIGLKGGVELHGQDFLPLVPQIVGVGLLGFILPFIFYPVLKYLGKLKKADAASIAAHYGSVSVGTFAVALGYLEARKIPFEEHVPLFVVILEIPAIIVGILLAKGLSKNTNWKLVFQEVFFGKSIVLLVGGLAIAWIVGSEGLKPLSPLFFDLFKGVLALFLLEMGLVVSKQLSSLRKYGVFLVVFAVCAPIVGSLFGIVLGGWLGLSIGGTTILATLAASGSYIAVPAAVRISIPEANPTLSLTASLGVTFPFNVVVGIPFYYYLTVLYFG